ncbi:hypothetical protein AB0L40_23420 [Patulibacter sp. NPDC049589]|uniref:hypothetical protein n=1 Tax=Patulibacter sp. NPDC049589 TaxID=3154731 RepID=UPI00342BF578
MLPGRPSSVAAAAPARTQRPPRRRPLALLLATLIALIATASPALAADAGVPDATLPGAYGTKKIDYDAGTLLLNLATPGQSTTVPMKGSITYPTGNGSQASKVIVFVHGRHGVCLGTSGTTSPPGPSPGTCLDSEAPDGTPVSTDIRSYGGYDYMAENLASHGYAVMSIEANITGFDNNYADAGAGARSQIINASLRLLDRWNNGLGPVTDDPDTTVGLKLVGRLELSSGVGLMGHSRGGDAVTDFVTYNRNLSSGRWLIDGVVALAPTAYSTAARTTTSGGTTTVTGPPRTPEGTNYVNLLPACDGDVNTLQGARFVENAKYAPGNAGVATMQWYVQGTNHNFYNTVWTGDDFGPAADPACTQRLGTTARLSPSDQRRVGLTLMNSFLRRYVGGEKAFDPLMTGEVTLPSTSCPVASGVACGEEVKTSYFGPTTKRLDVLKPAPTSDPIETATVPDPVDPTATTVAATGGPLTATGLATFEVCRPSAVPRRGLPKKPSAYPLCPDDNNNRSIGTQFAVAWDGPASLTAGLGADGGTKDVSTFGALTMRVAVNRNDPRNPAGNGFTPQSATQDLDVTITDAAGATATTTAAKWGTALEPSIGSSYQHIILNGLRIPLSAFAGVDLTKVASVTLGFGARTPTGSIQLADVAFQETAPDAPPAPVTPVIPPRDGPPSPVGDVLAPPVAPAAPAPGTPAKACVDTKRPTSRVSSIRATRTRIRVAGRATDKGCVTASGKAVAGKAGGGVQRTLVSVSKKSGEGCRFLNRKGKWGPEVYCDNPIVLFAKGTKTWSLAVKAKLAKGVYTVSVVTYDRTGNLAKAARQSVRVR